MTARINGVGARMPRALVCQLTAVALLHLTGHHNVFATWRGWLTIWLLGMVLAAPLYLMGRRASA